MVSSSTDSHRHLTWGRVTRGVSEQREEAAGSSTSRLWRCAAALLLQRLLPLSSRLVPPPSFRMRSCRGSSCAPPPISSSQPCVVMEAGLERMKEAAIGEETRRGLDWEEAADWGKVFHRSRFHFHRLLPRTREKQGDASGSRRKATGTSVRGCLCGPTPYATGPRRH
jgi:hypothetical protein